MIDPRKSPLLLILFAAMVSLPLPSPVVASGSGYPAVWAADPTRPSPPMEAFLAGELGILEADRLLVDHQILVFRQLSGIGMDREARHAFAGIWKPPTVVNAKIGAQRWEKVLRHHGESPRSRISRYSSIEREENGIRYRLYFRNCLDHALSTAAQTWQLRRAGYGRDPQRLEEWFRAQVQVFSNCSGKVGEIPEPLPAEAPEAARFDRDYQIAAAYFYSADYLEADRRFLAIAEQEGSPWRTWAPYLVARCRIRHASVGGSTDYLRAEEILEKILADPDLREHHRRSERLLALVRLQSDPEKQLRVLADQLLAEAPPERLDQPRIDFASGMGLRNSYDPPQRPCAGSGETPGDLLIEWISCLHSRDPSAAVTHLMDRFRSAPEPWRDLWWLAALSRTTRDHPETAEILGAANSLPPDHPLAATAAFHRARLSIAQGHLEGARRILDGELSNPSRTAHRSDENRLRQLRARTARTLRELLDDSLLRPVTNSHFDGMGGPPRTPINPSALEQNLLTGGAADFLNTYAQPEPLADLAASDLPLPPRVRASMQFRAWALQVIEGDPEAARRMTPALAELAPSLAPTLETFVAASEEERAFAAARVFLVEGVPAAVLPTGDGYGWTEWADEGPPLTPSSYTATEREHFRGLRQEPFQRSSFDRWVADAVFAWADLHRKDPRVPPALHQLVRLTKPWHRRNGRISKGAFDRLHRRYRDSEWARRTPYWYD